MGKRLIDILLIVVSAVVSLVTSTTRLSVQSDQYTEEWSGIGLFMFPVFIGALTLVFYLLTYISKQFYNTYRWWITGILCSINLLAGILLYLGLFE